MMTEAAGVEHFEQCIIIYQANTNSHAQYFVSFALPNAGLAPASLFLAWR